MIQPHIRRLAGVVMALAGLSQSVICQQQPVSPLVPQTGVTATVSGAVVDDLSGVGIRGARVFVRSTASQQIIAYESSSDDRGRFTVAGIAPGRYTVNVTHERYGSSEYRANHNQDATVVTLSPGSNLTSVVIGLSLPGVIIGRVLDENNEPAVSAQVQCLRVGFLAGRRKLSQSNLTTTNDLGEYRISGVLPGRYVIMAMYHPRRVGIRADTVIPSPEVAAAAGFGYAPAFFQDALSAETATEVEIRAGIEVNRLDLHMARTRIIQIRGSVAMTGSEPSAANVLLWRLDPSGRSSTPPSITRLDAKARFQFGDVQTGSYLLGVSTLDPSSRREAWEFLQVGSSDLDLKISLSPAIELKGSVIFDPPTPQPASRVTVVLQAVRIGGRQQVEVTPGQAFSIRGVPPDSYGVSLQGTQEGTYVKSVTYGNVDYTDSNLEVTPGSSGAELRVTVASDGAQLSGSVGLTDSATVAGATVVLVPDAPRRGIDRLYKVTTSDDSGAFRLKGIAPGRYMLFAWESVEADSWMDADFLKKVETLGQRVTLDANSSQSVAVKVIGKSKPQ